MDFNLNSEGYISLPMCQRVINTDISEDFTLPDYNPEVRRVLYVKEALLPPAKFISGNKLDVNGVVDYTLVYISHEGKLCSAPLSAEYAFSLPLDNAGDFDINQGINVMVSSVADASSVRLSSPRKLQIRSHIRSNVNAWGKKDTAPDVQGAVNADSLQFLNNRARCADMLCESSDIVTLNDEYTLPSEDCRVVLADSVVTVDNCRVEGDTVRINGQVVLKLLQMCGDNAERIVRKLDFDAESELDGVDMGGDCLCSAFGSVNDLSLNVEEGRVSIEASLVLEVCVAKNRDVSYTADAYSTEQTCRVNMLNESLPVVIDNRNFNLTQTERVPLEDLNFPEGGEIVDVWASAAVDEAVTEADKYVLRGQCRYNIVCMADGEYSCVTASLPFKYEADAEGEIASFDARTCVLNSRASRDGEAMNISSELALACTLMGSESIDRAESMSFGDPRESVSGEWTVCYTREDETPWQIAKRYGVRPETIDTAENRRFVMIEK